MAWAWYARKNKIRPLYRYRDQLNEYDNPTALSRKYQVYVPFNYMNYRMSAHYIEINKVFHLEMLKKVQVIVKLQFYTVKEELKQERNNCSDKVKKTRYITNTNYVYERPGWLAAPQEQ